MAGEPEADEERSGPQATPPGRAVRAARGFGRWLLLLAVGLALAIAAKTFVVQPFFIPSPSMEPTLAAGDRVIVDKLRFRLADPHRGDIVVFDRPGNAGGSLEIRNLIKRVVAVEGDEIEARQGAVYRNGQRLDEPYLRAGTVTTDIARRTVPAGTVWVMGDNRAVSEDSRLFGPVPRSLIVGRALVLAWPPSRFGWLRG